MKQFACNLSFITLFFETFPRHNSVATSFLTFIPFPFFVICNTIECDTVHSLNKRNQRNGQNFANYLHEYGVQLENLLEY